MNSKIKKQNLVAEINITPFTDVILVLLIIFMVATPLISQSTVKVDLPRTSSATQTQEKSQVFISITNEGMIYLGNDLVTRKELKSKIKLLKNNNPNIVVILRSDKLVRFKDIVSVLDTLTELDIRNLNIATINEQ
ncbi:MAG: biopolymer transporter ExbD [Candidatus Omnitrophica bacterium]|nr:biopolymer transporter ExbD [Candidatus Omnitrophota bacterium]